MRYAIQTIGFLALFAFVAAGDTFARDNSNAREEFPNSIVRDESAPRGKAAKPDQAKAPKKPVKRIRRGSSSPSPVPPYRSPLTPLGVAPQVIPPPPVAQPASPPGVVPGIRSHIGPAVTPPRKSGETFHDRAVNCVHTGTAIGVAPGRIGAYTRGCVNQ